MTVITLEQAKGIIQAGFNKARDMELKPMAIAILDAGGHMIAFERQDGAPFIRFDIAYGKAWAAISMGVSSRWYHEQAASRPHFIDSLVATSGGRIIPVPGGLRVLDRDNQAIGAIGVTGDTSDNDEIVAIAGIESENFFAG